MFGGVGILWCAFLCWLGLGGSDIITTQGHFGVTDDKYDNVVVGIAGTHLPSNVASFSLPAGMREQEALLWCLYKCVENPRCSSFVFYTDLTYCMLSTFDMCVDHKSQVYGMSGVRTYDVRLGSLPQPITTCHSACVGTCSYCGRKNCKGANCDVCAHYCWDPQVYNSTDRTLLWPDLQLSRSRYIYCDNGWQKIWDYNNVKDLPTLNVYPLLFTTPTTLRLAVTYNYTTVLYSYFNNFTLAGNMISVGSYLKGKAGNYWRAPFTNQSLVFNSSCPFFYPVSAINCTPGAVSNSSMLWRTGSSAFDTSVTATNVSVTTVQLWVIPKGMEWFSP